MKTKESLRYEDAAEPKTVTGWVCKKCRRYWGDDEHMARWCCSTDQPCECGKRKDSKSWIRCKDCRDQSDEAKFASLPKVEWDGETALCVWDSDEFFFDADSVRDYCEEHRIRPENLRLAICKLKTGNRTFEMNEFLSDELPEDYTIDADDIDKTVNDWIEKNAPKLWHPTGKIASPESVALHVGEVDFSEYDHGEPVG